jgi:hypothetical protein
LIILAMKYAPGEPRSLRNPIPIIKKITYNKPMNAGETTLLDTRSFATVLDDACTKLWDRKVRYTLRRIDELGEILEKTERELDDLLRGRGAFCP